MLTDLEVRWWVIWEINVGKGGFENF